MSGVCLIIAATNTFLLISFYFHLLRCFHDVVKFVFFSLVTALLLSHFILFFVFVRYAYFFL